MRAPLVAYWTKLVIESWIGQLSGSYCGVADGRERAHPSANPLSAAPITAHPEQLAVMTTSPHRIPQSSRLILATPPPLPLGGGSSPTAHKWPASGGMG